MMLLHETVGIEQWRIYLHDANEIAQIVGAILVMIYVIYTYKTFRQIKKQTDYQQDAYLRVEPTIEKEISKGATTIKVKDGRPVVLSSRESGLTSKYLEKTIPDQMKATLKPIFSLKDNLYEGNYFTLELTNFGNSEINEINVIMDMIISNSDELVEKRMLKKEEEHNFEFEIKEAIQGSRGKIKIPLISTAAFPIYEMYITGTYTDVRGKTYPIHPISFTGENDHFHQLPKVSGSEEDSKEKDKPAF